MKTIEQLLEIQQEYEYFSNHSTTKEEVESLKQDSRLSTDFLQEIVIPCAVDRIKGR